MACPWPPFAFGINRAGGSNFRFLGFEMPVRSHMFYIAVFGLRGYGLDYNILQLGDEYDKIFQNS